MKNPWDVKPQDNRVADGLTTFIIYCEDQNSEPFYFNSFRSNKVKINTIPHQKSGRLNLINAITDSIKEGRAIFDDRRYQIIEDLREYIWCVYDRDMESENLDEIRPTDHVSFDMAIQTAEAAGLHVAWSNDAFELWILLHFEDVIPEHVMHRNQIYSRLTQVFKSLAETEPSLKEVTSQAYFSYKSSFKKRHHFIDFVLPHLHNRRDIAIERAQMLQTHFETQGPVEFHKANPCTYVHKLVQKILDVQIR